MSKKERQRFSLVGLIIVLAVGILYYFYGKLLIDFVLYIAGIILHWIIGGTIVLTIVGLVTFFFLNDKQIEWLMDDTKRTQREKAEEEIIEKYINERIEQRESEENSKEV